MLTVIGNLVPCCGLGSSWNSAAAAQCTILCTAERYRCGTMLQPPQCKLIERQDRWNSDKKRPSQDCGVGSATKATDAARVDCQRTCYGWHGRHGGALKFGGLGARAHITAHRTSNADMPVPQTLRRCRRKQPRRVYASRASRWWSCVLLHRA
jgi:hypothetical protein